MPDFIPVLIAAVLIFIGLFLVFGEYFLPLFSDISTSISGTSFSVNIPLGEVFTVTHSTGSDRVLRLENETIQRGIGGGSFSDFAFEVDDFGDVSIGEIELEVINTNRYGPMIMTVNGKEVYRNYTSKGEHSIVFPGEFLRSQNIIKIDAGSSGWRIWAPTIYIYDMDITANYGRDNVKQFTIKIGESDLGKVKVARLFLDIEKISGTGKIFVKFNGEIVYSGKSSYEIIIPKTLLLEDNLVELYTQYNTKYTITSLRAELR